MNSNESEGVKDYLHTVKIGLQGSIRHTENAIRVIDDGIKRFEKVNEDPSDFLADLVGNLALSGTTNHFILGALCHIHGIDFRQLTEVARTSNEFLVDETDRLSRWPS